MIDHPQLTSGPARKIKVLHIIKSLVLGGAETNLRNLIQATDPQRIDMHVAYSVGGPFEESFRQRGVSLYKYAERNHKVKSLATIGIILKLAFYIRKHRIQVVHTHNYSGHVWGALAAKLAGAKILEHTHDFRFEEPDYNSSRGINPTQFRFIRYTTPLSDRIVVLTRNNLNFLMKHQLVPLQKVEVI